MSENLHRAFAASVDEAIDRKLESEAEVLVLAAQAKLLSRIARDAYLDPYAAAKAIQESLPIETSHPSLAYLRAAVLEVAFKNMNPVKKAAWTEFDVHRHFWSSLGSYLPGAARVERKVIPEHQPDGWVSFEGEVMPVEIKRGSFTNSSMRQLLRYMQAYGALKGVAVAQRITATPNPSILFVAYKTEGLRP